MAIGRISGPLLKANLLRDGVDLAFETDLLYLNVVDGRIGVKTSSPTHDLTVNGTTRTTNLEVQTQAVIGQSPGNIFTISGNTIENTNGIINLNPSGDTPVVYQGTIVTGDIQIGSNTIETTAVDGDLIIQTNGTGQVNINSNVLIDGDLHATGTITADGDINIGDEDTDNITFNADIKSNIIPDQTATYDLGSDPLTGGKEWRTAYIKDIIANSITADSILVDGINLVLPQGNILYVATTGNNDNSGVHEHDPYLTLKFALSQASAGDTVYIYPGSYQEVFPLTIPAGVTVKGAGIRAVNIQPTLETVDLDGFLLNGETTVEDLTVSGFKFNAINNTGYAFRFASNLNVTSRSPYVRNVTVLARGSVVSESDPYGFDSDDAGKGAFIDGSVAMSTSKEAAMLFHSVTFFTPNQECIVATNGVRIEWLNSFTYFADKGIYAYAGTSGFANNGLTRLRINTQTGSWNVGNTLTYYDTDGTTVLASGVIASIIGDYVNLTGNVDGFETITDRLGKTVYAQGDAKLSTAIKKFGTASLALDGTGDYVTVSTNPDFAYGTGDFTIEMWVYRTTSSGLVQILLDQRTSAETTYAPVVFINASNQLAYNDGEGTTKITGTTTIPLNSWSHVAVSRSGTSTNLFLNGVQEGSTYTDTRNYIQTPVRIGARWNDTGYFQGYIDDLRISKGIARYTVNFTTPTAAFTGDLNTVLLLHFDGANNSITFIDDGITFQDLRTSAGGSAQLINFADYSDFGAEIRSIGSANVYGNYGTYGDGKGVVIYLISQNYAYVGSGKLSSNDPNDQIAANEVVELNDAEIYYTSVDNEGNFKVGDNFFVNQKTGDVLFNNQALTITAPDGVTFTDGVNTTILLPGSVTTGNIKISGNTVESLTGDINVTAASGEINLQNNTFITGDLDVTGNVTIGGNIQIGDQSSDSINFVGSIDTNIVPEADRTYDLGTIDKRWDNAYLSRVEIDDLVIDSNTISTTANNDDLQLIANGTGRIYIPSNNVQIDQSLTVLGTTTLSVPAGTALDVTGIIDHTGDVTQTGDYTQTGDTNITGNLTVSTWAQFEDIRIDTNIISTTQTNSNLVLAANGEGTIYVPSNDVQIDQNLTVLGQINAGSLNVTNTVTANAFTTGDILIDDNYITTTLTNSNLELRANGTGKIYVPSNDVVFDQTLTVNELTTLSVTSGTALDVTGDIEQTGDVTQTGDYTQTGDLDITGNLTVSTWGQFEDIRIDTNIISTTLTDSDLVLEANGTGQIYIPSNDVLLGQNLTVVGLAEFGTLNVTNTVTANAITTGDILIDDNYITTTLTDSDLELRANGTGKIYVPNNDVVFDQNLTVNGLTTLVITTGTALDVTGIIDHTGDVTQTGDYTQTGDLEITGNFAVSGNAQFENILISTNTLGTTVTDSDLELRANGTGKIYVPSNNVLFDQDLTVNGVTTLDELQVTNTVTTNAITTGDILIDDNYITTTLTNSSLELRANGTGEIVVPSNSVQIAQNLVVLGTTTLSVPAGTALDVTGIIDHTGDVTQTGDYTQTGDLDITGNLTVSTWAQFEDIRVDGNTVSTTVVDSDLILEANGTGKIYVPTSDVLLGQDLTVNGNTYLDAVQVTGTVTTNAITTGDILIDDNYITTTLTDSDLELRANGTGKIYVPNNDVVLDQNLTVDNNLTVTTGTTYLKSVSITGDVTQTGDTEITGDFTSTGNTTVTGNITATGYLQLPNIRLDGNTVSTTVTNSDLELVVNGTGSIVVEDLAVQSNVIRNTTTNGDIVLKPQGTGTVVINSNQSLVIPVGTTLERPSTPAVGAIRYNTNLTRYEGWNGSYWIALAGVQDVDGNTYIKAEDTPGANDNTLYFYADNNLMATIDSTKLFAERLQTNQLDVYDNTITTVLPNTDILLETPGSAGVVVGNIKFANNTVSNIVPNAVTAVTQSGTGYVKIAGSNGVVIPSGSTENRPSVVELGMMRYNTTLDLVEIFNGLTWGGVGGASSGITRDEATDIAIEAVLILG
jgi:cytoskeletal protein CcmA (bactofilin family)